MVDAKAVAQDFREFAAVGGAEIGVVEGAGDGVFFLLGAEVGGEQVAGGVGAGVLGEVDEIDGRAAGFVEFGDFFLELKKMGKKWGQGANLDKLYRRDQSKITSPGY